MLGARHLRHVRVCCGPLDLHLLFEGGDRDPEFLWVRGNPSKQSELDKVRLTHPGVPLTLYANGSGGLLERMATTGLEAMATPASSLASSTLLASAPPWRGRNRSREEFCRDEGGVSTCSPSFGLRLVMDCRRSESIFRSQCLST